MQAIVALALLSSVFASKILEEDKKTPAIRAELIAEINVSGK